MAVVNIRVTEGAPSSEEWHRLATRRGALGLCPSCAQPVSHYLEHGDWDDSFTCKTVWSDPLVELVEAGDRARSRKVIRRHQARSG